MIGPGSILQPPSVEKLAAHQLKIESIVESAAGQATRRCCGRCLGECVQVTRVIAPGANKFKRIKGLAASRADDLLKRSALIEAATREGRTLVVLIKEIGTDFLFAMRAVASASMSSGLSSVPVPMPPPELLAAAAGPGKRAAKRSRRSATSRRLRWVPRRMKRPRTVASGWAAAPVPGIHVDRL